MTDQEKERIENALGIAAIHAGHTNGAELTRLLLADPARWSLSFTAAGELEIRDNGRPLTVKAALASVEQANRAEREWNESQAARGAMRDALLEKGVTGTPRPAPPDAPEPTDLTPGQQMTIAIGSKVPR